MSCSDGTTLMCRYCKGTGRYQLLDKVVDCDQCDAAAPESDEKQPDSAAKLRFPSTLPPGVIGEVRGIIGRAWSDWASGAQAKR